MARKRLVAGIFRLVKMHVLPQSKKIELQFIPSDAEVTENDVLKDMRFSPTEGPCVLIVTKEISDRLHLHDAYEVQLLGTGTKLKATIDLKKT